MRTVKLADRLVVRRFEGEPDGLVFAVGFEARSIHVAESFGEKIPNLAPIGFATRELLSFNANKRAVEALGSHVIRLNELAFRDWVLKELPAFAAKCRHVAIDVSSFSRDRLSLLIHALSNEVMAGSLQRMSLLYAPAKYGADGIGPAITTVASAELLAGFEGDWSDPDRPLTAILGLGFEPGRAVGAIEILEPHHVILLLPTGIDERYDERVASENESLLDPDSGPLTVSFDVKNPLELLSLISRTVSGISVHGRSVLVPMGPKIVAAVSCLVSVGVLPRTPIWRLSGGGLAEPVDAFAEGTICGLTVSLDETSTAATFRPVD